MNQKLSDKACEQLNAWLGGFNSILRRMTQSNFNWFLHFMLFYHTVHVIARQKDSANAGDRGSDGDSGSDSDNDT